MEGLTRLVSESLARHGFDRPLDYRRLHWSRWFRCESHHSLLFVPSKPGVFALAEEIMDLDTPIAHVETAPVATARVGTDAFVRPATPERSEGERLHIDSHAATAAKPALSAVEGAVPRTLSEAKGSGPLPESATRNPEPRRMLAVTQFFEDDDMAFVLDRMLSTQNPMRARLVSGRYFVRFVVIDDQCQRRTICNALNQWMVTAAEKATGIGSHFATSLELTSATEYVPASAKQSLFASATDTHVAADAFVRRPVESTWPQVADATLANQPEKSGLPQTPAAAAHSGSGAATNIHPNPFPSGF